MVVYVVNIEAIIRSSSNPKQKCMDNADKISN